MKRSMHFARQARICDRPVDGSINKILMTACYSHVKRGRRRRRNRECNRFTSETKSTSSTTDIILFWLVEYCDIKNNLVSVGVRFTSSTSCFTDRYFSSTNHVADKILSCKNLKFVGNTALGYCQVHDFSRSFLLICVEN